MNTPINSPIPVRKYPVRKPSPFKPPPKKAWHIDLKDADLERMLEKLECISNDVESAVDAILDRLGVEEEDASTDEEEGLCPE